MHRSRSGTVVRSENSIPGECRSLHHSMVLQHCMVFSSCCRALGTRFHYASSSEDHFSTAFHLKKGEKPQSADPETAVSGAPWSSVQSYGEKGEELQTNKTQTQPICNSIGCTAALKWLSSLPKLAAVAGQGRTRCRGCVCVLYAGLAAPVSRAARCCLDAAVIAGLI